MSLSLPRGHQTHLRAACLPAPSVQDIGLTPSARLTTEGPPGLDRYSLRPYDLAPAAQLPPWQPVAMKTGQSPRQEAAMTMMQSLGGSQDDDTTGEIMDPSSHPVAIPSAWGRLGRKTEVVERNVLILANKHGSAAMDAAAELEEALLPLLAVHVSDGGDNGDGRGEKLEETPEPRKTTLCWSRAAKNLASQRGRGLSTGCV